MKKTILHIVTILAAFLLGVFGMGYYLTAGNIDSTAVMADAALPTVSLVQDGRTLNLLHGYARSMDGAYMRDAVLPLPSDRMVTLSIDSPDLAVSQVHYEVRSLDTTRLVEDGDLTELTGGSGSQTVSLQLKDLLDEGEEYLLVLTLELPKGEEAYYYTRLANLGDTHLSESLDFIDEIHTALFDKENTVSISAYLETDSSADNGTLDEVTIHSRYRQMIWSDMDVQQVGETRVSVTEVENAVTSARLEYEVSYVNDDGETEYYEVTEAYRVRYTAQRMYLLNYDRTVDRIFDPSLSIFSENALMLGILNTEVEYRKNTEENVVGFVQNGQLWCYDTAQNKLSLVFGFRQNEDVRSNYGAHEIRILNIEDSGSMDFLVYGYMNRGGHEGEMGIAVYSYDALTNSVEERIFIESDRSFAALEAQLGDLAYVNAKDELYLYDEGDILRIDLNTRSCEVIASGVAKESCLTSDDGHLAAWHQESSLDDSVSVICMNLDDGSTRTVSAQDGFYIRALGFMGTDFIYGEARQTDITTDLTGQTVFPMGHLVIQDEQGGTVREFDYESQGKYVRSIEIENNRITLNCMTRGADGGYADSGTEPITSQAAETEEKIVLDTRNDSVKKREYYLALSGNGSRQKPRRLSPKQVVFSEDRTLQLESGTDSFYYIYAYQGLCEGAYADISDAVQLAYDRMGVVTDSSQHILWKRGGRRTTASIGGLTNPQEKAGESSLQAALEILLGTQNTYADTAAYLNAGMTPGEILAEQMNGRVLDLSGCSVSMVLYYVSEGYPVLALEGDSQAELIVGYDQQNVILLNTLTGETYRKGNNDSDTDFSARGNLFLVCLPEEE